MAEEITSNPYEEARKQRLLENNKRFEELKIQKIAKTLTALSKPKKKKMFPEKCDAILRNGNAQMQLRRSKRTHNPTPVYRHDVKPVEEVKIPTDKERQLALESALKFQIEMQSEFPSFVISMSRANVCNKFVVHLHKEFLEKHLPQCDMDMVLEDEDGNQYKVYKSMHGRFGFGWRSFAIEHKLEFGDTLIFELVEPQRFKIYIFKALDDKVKEEAVNSNPVDGLDIIKTLQEVENSIDEKRQLAKKSALKFQSEMKSENPSYVRSISHGSICCNFAMHLQRKFIKKYLPECEMDMVLEDEDGNEYEAVKSKHGNLNIGWKAFAIEHKLEYGDALLFELVEPQRFKIYIFKASDENVKEEAAETETTLTENGKKNIAIKVEGN